MRSNNLQTISALIVAFNEEDNLDKTLSCLREFEEVIVLDSGSTDRTAEIASRFPNVTLHVRPFDNFMNQWNHGHTLASNVWILSLDADYQVSPKLLQEINSLDLNEKAYQAKFQFYIYGDPLFGSILPPRIILYRKDTCAYMQDGHTQQLQVSGKIASLVHPIIHDDRKSLTRWLQSQHRYAIDEWDKLSGPSARIVGADKIRMKTWISPFLVFWYTLLFKGAILNGRKGLYYAFQRMYAELLFLLRRLEDSVSKNNPASKL